MTIINENRRRAVVRLVENREPLGTIICDNNDNALDVTGLTFTFRMVNLDDKSVKIDDQPVTIVDAPNGKVQYQFAAADVDTPGLYACYFKDDSSPPREWPFDGAKLLVKIVRRTDR